MSARVRSEARRDGSSVDDTTLESLREIEANRLGFLARIIPLFPVEGADRIAELKAAIDSGDRGQLERVAHTLSSSAGMVGAFRLSALCLELQNAARDAAPPTRFIEPIDAEFDRVATILSGILVQGELARAPR